MRGSSSVSPFPPAAGQPLLWWPYPSLRGSLCVFIYLYIYTCVYICIHTHTYIYGLPSPKESRGERRGIAHGPGGRGIFPFTQNGEKLFRAGYSNELPQFTNRALFAAGEGTLPLLANLFVVPTRWHLAAGTTPCGLPTVTRKILKAAKLLRKYLEKNC